MSPLLATLADRIGTLFVNALAVGGAFLLGQVVAVVLLWLFRMLVLRKRRIPQMVRQFVRIVGGVLAAIIAVILLFTQGPGFGLGGGFGVGDDPGKTAKAKDDPSSVPQPKEEPPEPIDLAAGGTTARVLMLGGAMVSGERFYVLEGTREPLTLVELREKLTPRLNARPPDGPLKQVEVQVFANSVAAGSAPVLALEDWARATALAVRVVKLPGDLP